MAAIHQQDNGIRRPAASTITDRVLEAIIQYKCSGRPAHVADTKVKQVIYSQLYSEGLKPNQILLAGSKYEGMPWAVCGDVDFMSCDGSYPIVVPAGQEPDHQLENTNTGKVTATTNDVYPAHIYLQVANIDSYSLSPLMKLIVSEEGYLQSSRFVHSVLGCSGVAATTPTFSGHPQYGMQDMVPCLKSPYWPPEAAAYLTRPKLHSWPPVSVLEHIRDGGCHVVAKSHPTSRSPDIEWRWSFSVAERELLDNMQPKMAWCLYTLKILKKTIWPHDGRHHIFCSYYIKTACLWLHEKLHIAGLTSMDLCRIALHYLIECYKERYLPHYFIPGHNHLGGLTTDACTDMHQRLVMALQQLQQRVAQCLFSDSELLRVLNKQAYEALQEYCLTCQWKRLPLPGPSLGQGTEAYHHEASYWTGFWSTGYYRVMYDIIEEKIKAGDPPAQIVRIPERILLPVIQNTERIIQPMAALAQVFIQTLNRLTGELLLSLSVHYMSSDGKISNSCATKAMLYYAKGSQGHPDGWTDKGLTELVLAAQALSLPPEVAKPANHTVQAQAATGGGEEEPSEQQQDVINKVYY